MRRWLKVFICIVILATGASLSPASADDQACDPIRATIEKLNSIDRLQTSSDYTNDGLGKSGIVERILTDGKTYVRWNKGPWRVRDWPPLLLAIGGVPTVSNCQMVGEEIKDGILTTVLIYERYRPESSAQVRMWISKQTGLPVQSHLKAIQPDNGEEYTTTFSYDPNVGDPLSPPKQ